MNNLMRTTSFSMFFVALATILHPASTVSAQERTIESQFSIRNRNEETLPTAQSGRRESRTRLNNTQRNNSLGTTEHILEQIDLKASSVVDAARMIAEISGINVVATEEAGKKTVTLYLQNIRAIDAIETLASVAGIWYREDSTTGTIRLMTTEEYQNDIVIRRDDITRVFTLLHPNALGVATAIRDLHGNRVIMNIAAIDDDVLLQSFATTLSGNSTVGVGGQGGLGSGSLLGGGGIGGFGGVGGGFGGGNLGGGGIGGGGLAIGGFGGGGIGGGFGGGRNFVGGQNSFQRNGLGFNLRDQFLPEGRLTPGQAALIQQQLINSAEAEQVVDNAISSAEIAKISQQEPPIYVTINRAHNLVMVRTSDKQAMEAIDQLINEIDRPTPQVLLEMKILEVTLDDTFRSAFDIQFNNGAQGPTAVEQIARNPFLLNPATAAQSVLGAVNVPAEGGSFVYQFLNDNIRARLEVLQTNGRLETVATPLLLASNNRAARIFVGEERVLVRSVNSDVIVPATGATTTAISPVTEIVDIGTNLFIVPKINADRTVTLVINQDNSTVNPDSASIPVAGLNGAITDFPIDTVNTASVSGTVVAQDGLTIAIGGLIRESVITNIRKVPVLGDIPVVGRAFRRELDSKTKTELVLLITPHVITTPLEGQRKSLNRAECLSDACVLRHALQPPHNAETGPHQPWSPRRLQTGYERTVGEDTGYSLGEPEIVQPANEYSEK